MRRFLRVVAVILVVLLVLLAAAWFGGRAWLARSVAPEAGTLRAAGLRQPVQVLFDGKGIPQIYAATREDAWFAVGWQHAAERLFQMELVRRMAEGELSELFGKDAYEIDLFQRQVGFARTARREVGTLDPRARAALEAYVGGVNAYVSQAGMLPPEFVLLRLKPRAWTVEDCLAIALYQTWYADSLMNEERQYGPLIRKFGDTARRLLNESFPWSPSTVDTAFAPGALRMADGSNSWAVAPSRSASHAALHAADPHLAVNQVPGFWYALGVHSADGLDVVGVTAPGNPFVVLGHNRDISFAITVAAVDVVDYYRESLDFKPWPVVRIGDRIVPVHVEKESIRVKGEPEPRKVEVWSTPHGAVIEHDEEKGLVLRWAGFDFPSGAIVNSAYALQFAADFDAFRSAVTNLGAFNINWVYTDRNGHIGYQLGTPVPIRTGDTFEERDGSNPETFWRGYVPPGATPHLLDPPSGWVASCNNQIVDQRWPYPLPGFYDPYRIVRATAALKGDRLLTVRDLEAMQMDLTSELALRWKGLAAEGAQRAGDADAAKSLRSWDGRVTVDSHEAALFETWWAYMLPRIFEDDLGKDWLNGHTMQEKVLTDNVASIIDDHRTPQVETAADLSAAAMKAVLADVGSKKWGDISTLTVRHPLSAVPVVGAWLGLNRGPYPAGGDGASLNANFSTFRPETKRFRSEVAPSMRFVLDWADPDAFTLTIPLGQSGNPFSPHYDDFRELHASGGRWIVPFSRAKVEARAVSRMTLVP